MIYFYSGTPGSGKSLNLARDICTKLRRGQDVICNFDINIDVVRKGFLGIFEFKKLGKFVYRDTFEITVPFLIEHAKKNHIRGKEGQTLLIIDECAIIFNSRDVKRNDRMEWIKFFQQHRKLGYNIILVAQNDRLIDRQIRAFIEYDCKHRKANNYRFIGQIITIFGFKLFAVVTYWYGVREKCAVEFFLYKKMYSKIYDSFAMFDDEDSMFGEGKSSERAEGVPSPNIDDEEENIKKIS